MAGMKGDLLTQLKAAQQAEETEQAPVEEVVVDTLQPAPEAAKEQVSQEAPARRSYTRRKKTGDEDSQKRPQTGPETASTAKQVSESVSAVNPDIMALYQHEGNKRVNYDFPVSLIMRMKRVVYWERYGTEKEFVMEAVEEMIKRVEDANGGVLPPTKDEEQELQQKREELEKLIR